MAPLAPPRQLPWSCLDTSTSNKTTTDPVQEKAAPTPVKSFVQALRNNVCDISLSQFPRPCVKEIKLQLPYQMLNMKLLLLYVKTIFTDA
ncbi:hypothetical protein A2U01_0056013 [Trifolium medium]|uniref:Uncharacterized protein n=1 Tax=Trifolium medium TaxID=97028 RepID=A0A392RF86_9FABA|nr:hypothetical protein [Trifolium medium]